MQEIFSTVIGAINNSLWSYVLPWLLIAAGLFFGIRTALVLSLIHI